MANQHRIITLIPAFKPAFIGDLLWSLRTQTRQPDRIVFSDDSPGGVYTETLMSEHWAAARHGLPIICVEGPRKGGVTNICALVTKWAGQADRFHLLLDDDVLYPTFYERHLAVHDAGGIAISASRRWTADDVGFPLGRQDLPAEVAASRAQWQRVPGSVVMQTTAAVCRNWIGEFSNVVFDKRCASVFASPHFAGVRFGGLIDLGVFMASSLIAPLGHIVDHLGAFRLSASGNSGHANGAMMKTAILGYAALVLGAHRAGHYSGAQVQYACGCVAMALEQHYADQTDLDGFRQPLSLLAQGHGEAQEGFIALWHDYLDARGI